VEKAARPNYIGGMRQKLLLVLLLVFPNIEVLAAEKPLPSSSQSFADRFYRTLSDLKVSGLPSDAQLKTLSPFLSSELIGLFEKAKREQSRSIRSNPGDKPPWIEGDLFSSLFEGFTSYKVGNPQDHDEGLALPIKLEYGPKKPKEVRWTDHLILERTNGEWKVANIIFKAKWEFKSGSSLKKVLTSP